MAIRATGSILDLHQRKKFPAFEFKIVSMEKVKITVAKGDGIGPEIMDATLDIILAAGARIEPEFITVGEEIYKKGITTGIPPEAWEVIRKNKVFLKAPITTPQGGGYKSLNVTIRKALGLYANVRPARSYHPFVPSKYPEMDVVVIRENEEDLYSGIEYQMSPQNIYALKVITYPGSERIIRFAFEYAKLYGRKSVTAMTKDNILKMTDGLFHKIFEKIGEEYPDIEKGHWIIDIGMAKLATKPEWFDVVVFPNLYGDIASDMVVEMTGSVGLGGSANIGDEYAMFEAVHGSAPKHAGKNEANPSGLLNAAIMMLVYIGQGDVAEKVENAWLKTLEDRIFTYDLARRAKEFGITDFTQVGTREFAQAVIDRLGQKPQHLKPASYASAGRFPKIKVTLTGGKDMVLKGVDIYIKAPGISAEDLGKKLEGLSTGALKFVILANRGQKVYPADYPGVFTTDHFSARFEGEPGKVTNDDIKELLRRIEEEGLEWTNVEKLYYIDGERAYTLAQGQ